MSVWHWIGLACAAAFVTKWLGYAVPARFLQNPRMTDMAACITVALLAALTVMNTFAQGQHVVVDARVAALLAAALALKLRLPFLWVVIVGAVVAAVMHRLG